MSKKKPIIGAHMSIAKSFVQAAQDTVAMGANALQLFLKSPRSAGKTKLTPEEAEAFRAYCKKEGIEFVVAHSSYLINFAKSLKDSPWALESLIDDLKSIEQLGGAGVVLHAGKSLGAEPGESEDQLVQNIQHVLQQTSQLSAQIILENMAGQGSEIGMTLEQLESIYKKLNKPARFSFCLDTCHLFGACYDLTTSKGVEEIMDEFDQRIGLNKLRLLHLNDAKNACGSKLDRHANLLEGQIGEKGIKALVQFAEKNNIPMILETPNENEGHQKDLKKLKGFLSEQ